MLKYTRLAQSKNKNLHPHDLFIYCYRYLFGYLDKFGIFFGGGLGYMELFLKLGTVLKSWSKTLRL